MDYKEKNVLVTGGTGTVGKEMIKFLIKENVKSITIVSRNELNQVILKREIIKLYGIDILNKLHFVLCDIRNNEIFKHLFINCDIVIHAAALKHIDLCEENIREAFETNVNGTLNVITNAINNNVEKVILLSTDKACSPTSVYGATKLISEREFINANKCGITKFSVLRCGNISGSNGSVIPFFKKLVAQGNTILPITDVEMCRFWFEPSDVVKSIDYALNNMIGGEVFIPKMPSFKILDLAKAISGQNEHRVVGLRKGEKIEESILNLDKSIYESDGMYVELNDTNINYTEYNPAFKFITSPTYTTKINTNWLSVEDIKNKLRNLGD